MTTNLSFNAAAMVCPVLGSLQEEARLREACSPRLFAAVPVATRSVKRAGGAVGDATSLRGL